MRFSLRPGVVAGVSIAATTTLALSLGVAYADDKPTVPTTQQLADARKDVAAKAQGVEELRQQLAAAQSQLAAAQTAASVASEEYNGAMWRLAESRKASKLAAAKVVRLKARLDAQCDAMKRLVVQSYQEGTQINSMTALLDAEGPESLMGRQAVVDMAGDALAHGLEKFAQLSADAAKAKKQADAAAKEQEELAKQAEAARAGAIGAVSAATALQSRIAGQRDQLVAELARSQNISVGLARQRQQGLEAIAEQKAKAAENAKAKEAAEQAEKQAKNAQKDVRNAADVPSAPAQPQESTTPAAPITTPPPVSSNPPTPTKGAAAAIAFAREQIGEPYVWGAAGPNSWDCSGLTSAAWARGGKSLPHYSRAQFTMGTRIALSSVRPGDLYFWSNNGSPSGIHHVAIAIGGGQFIEAPRTGLNVRVNSISNWFPTYAVRL